MNLGLVGQYVGAAERGQEDYQNRQQALVQKQQANELEALKLQDYKRQLAAQQQAMQDQKSGNDLWFKYFQSGGQNPQTIPPPPAQPPAPGQASIPMVNPAQTVQKSDPRQALAKGLKERADYLQTITDPQERQSFVNSVFGNIASMPNPKARDELSKAWSNVVQQSSQKVAPYKSMNGESAPQQPQASQIPQPPKMSLEQVAQWAVKNGVTNPNQFSAFLDKAQAFMSNDAKVEASYWKQQYQNQILQQNQQKIDQKAPLVGAQVEDIKSKVEDRPRRTEALFMNAASNSRKADAMAGNANGPTDKGAVEAATWNYLLKGTNPPARGGLYQATMKNVAQVAKENGMSVQELTSASADVKTKLSAKRNFEVRTQNLSRAENQLDREIPVMEDAMSKLDLPSIPAASRGKIWALREIGDPNVTKLDQAAKAVFNEFEGIITGNPGALNVQDVQASKEAYKDAQTPQQMKAAIEGMRRIIQNAKGSNDQTREEIMSGINDEFSKKKGLVFSSASELQQAIKDGKIKKGDTFNDPDGIQHVVN